METKILLSDILKNNGIDPKEVVLVRHVMKRHDFKKCFESGFLKEYTQIQGKDKKMLKECKYWMIFISTTGTNAKLYCTYKYKCCSPVLAHEMPNGYPCPEMYRGDAYLYELESTDEFSDLNNRLIIDWGTSTQSWYQNASNNKPVVAIHNQEKYQFKGYENSIFTFDELKNIVDDIGVGAYQEHQTALSSVKGVYLIIDTTDGKQYVGSAYNDNGILGRWSDYVKSHHGGNKELIRLLTQYPDRYKKFKFSILQIFSKGASDAEIIEAESLYKEKLCSIEFGLNDN